MSEAVLLRRLIGGVDNLPAGRAERLINGVETAIDALDAGTHTPSHLQSLINARTAYVTARTAGDGSTSAIVAARREFDTTMMRELHGNSDGQRAYRRALATPEVARPSASAALSAAADGDVSAAALRQAREAAARQATELRVERRAAVDGFREATGEGASAERVTEATQQLETFARNRGLIWGDVGHRAPVTTPEQATALLRRGQGISEAEFNTVFRPVAATADATADATVDAAARGPVISTYSQTPTMPGYDVTVRAGLDGPGFTPARGPDVVEAVVTPRMMDDVAADSLEIPTMSATRPAPENIDLSQAVREAPSAPAPAAARTADMTDAPTSSASSQIAAPLDVNALRRATLDLSSSDVVTRQAALKSIQDHAVSSGLITDADSIGRLPASALPDERRVHADMLQARLLAGQPVSAGELTDFTRIHNAEILTLQQRAAADSILAFHSSNTPGSSQDLFVKLRSVVSSPDYRQAATDAASPNAVLARLEANEAITVNDVNRLGRALAETHNVTTPPSLGDRMSGFIRKIPGLNALMPDAPPSVNGARMLPEHRAEAIMDGRAPWNNKVSLTGSAAAITAAGALVTGTVVATEGQPQNLILGIDFPWGKTQTLGAGLAERRMNNPDILNAFVMELSENPAGASSYDTGGFLDTLKTRGILSANSTEEPQAAAMFYRMRFIPEQAQYTQDLLRDVIQGNTGPEANAARLLMDTLYQQDNRFSGANSDPAVKIHYHLMRMGDPADENSVGRAEIARIQRGIEAGTATQFERAAFAIRNNELSGAALNETAANIYDSLDAQITGRQPAVSADTTAPSDEGTSLTKQQWVNGLRAPFIEAAVGNGVPRATAQTHFAQNLAPFFRRVADELENRDGEPGVSSADVNGLYNSPNMANIRDAITGPNNSDEVAEFRRQLEIRF